MLELILVQCVGVFVLSVSVIEVELLVYDVLGDAIHLNLRFVDNHFGVSHSTRIDFSLYNFRFKQRSLPNAYTNLELG